MNYIYLEKHASNKVQQAYIEGASNNHVVSKTFKLDAFIYKQLPIYLCLPYNQSTIFNLYLIGNLNLSSIDLKTGEVYQIKGTLKNIQVIPFYNARKVEFKRLYTRRERLTKDISYSSYYSGL